MTHIYNLIKYIVDTRSTGLKFSKIEDPDQSMGCLKFYVDSDWDGDNVSRKYVSFWVVYIQNNPIEWESLQQQKNLNHPQKKSLLKSQIYEKKKISFLIFLNYLVSILNILL